MKNTCFVIMPIGDQPGTASAAELRSRYTDLIKEALLKARPTMEVVRADDIARPGGITTDVLTHIMYSDYVLADITYVNPNVFYELGLRHACRSGTILIRDVHGSSTPFDLYDLRHIPYENTPTGLKQLAEQLRKHLEWIDSNRGQPDNKMLEIARLTRYPYPNFSRTQYPDAVESVITEQLYSLNFYKQKIAFTLEIEEASGLRVVILTTLSYLVTNHTTEPHHWRMQKKVRDKAWEVLDVRFNDRVINPEILDNQYGRGIRSPQLMRPGETASVLFKVREQFRARDFELYTTYHPATDLTVAVRNPHPKLSFDFELFYFTDVPLQRDGHTVWVQFDRGILPHQGVRLNWRYENESATH